LGVWIRAPDPDVYARWELELDTISDEQKTAQANLSKADAKWEASKMFCKHKEEVYLDALNDQTAKKEVVDRFAAVKADVDARYKRRWEEMSYLFSPRADGVQARSDPDCDWRCNLRCRSA